MSKAKYKSDPYAVITLYDFKAMKKGEHCEYLFGTMNQIHDFGNFNQLRVVREAIDQGIVTAYQRVVDSFEREKDIGVDIHNIYSYNVVRL